MPHYGRHCCSVTLLILYYCIIAILLVRHTVTLLYCSITVYRCSHYVALPLPLRPFPLLSYYGSPLPAPVIFPRTPAQFLELHTDTVDNAPYRSITMAPYSYMACANARLPPLPFPRFYVFSYRFPFPASTIFPRTPVQRVELHTDTVVIAPHLQQSTIRRLVPGWSLREDG